MAVASLAVVLAAGFRRPKGSEGPGGKGRGEQPPFRFADAPGWRRSVRFPPGRGNPAHAHGRPHFQAPAGRTLRYPAPVGSRVPSAAASPQQRGDTCPLPMRAKPARSARGYPPCGRCCAHLQRKLIAQPETPRGRPGLVAAILGVARRQQGRSGAYAIRPYSGQTDRLVRHNPSALGVAGLKRSRAGCGSIPRQFSGTAQPALRRGA
jgi:hypothetical protein